LRLIDLRINFYELRTSGRINLLDIEAAERLINRGVFYRVDKCVSLFILLLFAVWCN